LRSSGYESGTESTDETTAEELFGRLYLDDACDGELINTDSSEWHELVTAPMFTSSVLEKTASAESSSTCNVPASHR